MAMQSGLETYEHSFDAGWKSEPRLTVSEWADANRILGNRAGRSALHWRTSTTPYLQEIMDALDPGKKQWPHLRACITKGQGAVKALKE